MLSQNLYFCTSKASKLSTCLPLPNDRRTLSALASLVRHVGVVCWVEVILAPLLIRALKLLDAVRISERVHRVLARTGARRHVGAHNRPAVADKTVLEHRGEGGAAERHVLAVLVQRADALLER